MSNAVFPTLPGLKWDIVKQPQWATLTHRVTSGKEVRAALMNYPLYTFKLSYEILRADSTAELQTLMGFFNARQGAFDSFLYSDPTDNSVTAQITGTGNGTTTQFQLIRAYGGFNEPVQNLNGAPSIYIGGVLKTAGTDYNINSTGLVTFTTAPAPGALITWTGSFYYRVRFSQDMAEFDNFMFQIWELKKLELVTVKL